MQTGKNPINGKFIKGNKAGVGRPAGSKSKAQIFLEQIGSENAEAILKKVIELALSGDLPAAKLILDRVMPVPKIQTFVKSDAIKNLHTQTDINTAMTAIVSQVGDSELSLEEALELIKLVETKGLSIQKCISDELDEIRGKIENMEAIS